MAQAGHESITRRTLFAGAAVGAALVPGIALAGHPDEALLALDREFCVEIAEQGKIDAKWGNTDSPQATEETEASYDRVSALVRRIETCRAATKEGLQVKARAILWCHGFESDLWLTDQSTTDMRLAYQIVRDLLAG